MDFSDVSDVASKASRLNDHDFIVLFRSLKITMHSRKVAKINTKLKEFCPGLPDLHDVSIKKKGYKIMLTFFDYEFLITKKIDDYYCKCRRIDESTPDESIKNMFVEVDYFFGNDRNFSELGRYIEDPNDLDSPQFDMNPTYDVESGNEETNEVKDNKEENSCEESDKENSF